MLICGQRMPVDDAGSKIPKKPLYLVFALIAAILIGVGSCNEGVATMEFYRGPALDIAPVAASVARDDDRAAITEAMNRLMVAKDGAKNRAFPIGVAAFVIGGAVTFFTWGAIAGRATSRKLLIQMLIAQGLLSIVAYVLLTPELRSAEAGVVHALMLSWLHANQTEALAESLPTSIEALAQITPVISLGIGLIVKLLIIAALVTKRSSEYFQKMSELLR